MLYPQYFIDYLRNCRGDPGPKAMNLFQHFVFFLVLGLATAIPSLGQEMTLFDAVEKFNCEDLLARLDGFSHHVAYDPTPSIGEVVLIPGPNPIENAKHAKYLQSYVFRRKLPDKLTVAVTKPQGQMRVEFWSGPVGSKRTLVSHTLSLKLSNVTSPIVFDSDLFEMYVDKGKRHFVGVGCAACCISVLDWDLLSQVLDANPNLSTYLVIRGKPSRHRLLTAGIRGYMRDANFNEKKVKFLYANKNIVDSNQFTEFAIYLSPSIIRSARELRKDRD